jgi:predicted hydrocarbon binding protein
MSERFPKEIPVATFSRKRRLAHVIIKLKDVTGAMANILAITAREGVDIRQSSAYAVPKGSYAVYNSFVWLRKEGYKLEDLVKKLEASPYVLGVQAKEGVEGSVVDTLAFPFQFAGTRVVILETQGVVDMFEALQSVFGTGGSVIIQQQGVSYGKAQAVELAMTLTRPYMIRNYQYGLQLLMATGWGSPEVVRADEDLTKVVVRIRGCFECNGRRKGHSGHFMSGYLAGVFSFLSGKEVHGAETKCLATGDEYCEFSIA